MALLGAFCLGGFFSMAMVGGLSYGFECKALGGSPPKAINNFLHEGMENHLIDKAEKIEENTQGFGW